MENCSNQLNDIDRYEQMGEMRGCKKLGRLQDRMGGCKSKWGEATQEGLKRNKEDQALIVISANLI